MPTGPRCRCHVPVLLLALLPAVLPQQNTLAAGREGGRPGAAQVRLPLTPARRGQRSLSPPLPRRPSARRPRPERSLLRKRRPGRPAFPHAAGFPVQALIAAAGAQAVPRSWAPWCLHSGDADPCGCHGRCAVPHMVPATAGEGAGAVGGGGGGSDYGRCSSAGTAASKLREWRQRRGTGTGEGPAVAEKGSGERRAKVYVYELPEGLNSECEELMSRWNWMVDIGLEEWPPQMLGDLANFAFALEPVVHAVLRQSRHRTLDPASADWFYVPFYAACSWRQSRYVEEVAPGATACLCA